MSRVEKLQNYNSKERRKQLIKDQRLIDKNMIANRNKCFHQDDRGTRAVRPSNPADAMVNGKTYKWICADCGEPLEHIKIKMSDIDNACVTLRDAINQIKQSLNRRSHRDMVLGDRLVKAIEVLPLTRDYYKLIMYDGKKRSFKGSERKRVRRV